MKTERSQADQQLVNDVFLSEPVSAGPDRARQAAIAAFRQTRLLRRIRNYGGASLLITAALALAFHYTRTERPVAAVVTQSAPHMAANPENSKPLPTLIDEELVASFPSNTCFLAEVDGRQILVFTEPELKAKFLHQP